LMLALARAGVGHVALMRDPSHPTPIVAAVEDDETADASTASLEDRVADPPQVIPSDPAERPSLDAADVELALRYLPDYTTLIVAEPQPDAVVAIVAEAASFSGAAFVLVVDGAGGGSASPVSAVVFENPAIDPDGAFATMLGELAAAIDRGTPVEAAFREIEGRLGLTPAG
jgi:hypothetical protein